MPKTRQKDTAPRIALDCDKLGLLSAACTASIVMGLCFWRGVSPLGTLLRVTAALLVGYVAAFFLVRVVLHTALTELVSDQQPGKRAGAAQDEPADGAAVDTINEGE